jgi:hypothetical protein
MPFNAATYHANKYQSKAWQQLATARDIKARAARGEAYDWEVSRIAIFVQLARHSMHTSLYSRAMAQIGRNVTP